MITPPALAKWRRLVKARNSSGIAELLDDNMVFFSPVAQSPCGKDEAVVYLAGAFKVFFNDTYRYVREFVRDKDAVLEFEVELDGITVNGVDIISWNDADKIVEIKVMLRPVQSVNRIHENMAAKLKARL